MITLPKYTFINGPAGSGKSSLATLFCKNDSSLWRESFAQPIRDMIYAVFFPEEGPISFTFDLRDGSTKAADFRYSYPQGYNRFRTITSNRDAMISFSEDWMKPAFGDDIFARLCLARCKDQEMFYDRFVIDDSGFPHEAEYIISQVGAENCLLINLHRPGCHFTGDSRSYIDLTHVKAIDLYNDGPTPESMLDALQLALGNL